MKAAPWLLALLTAACGRGGGSPNVEAETPPFTASQLALLVAEGNGTGEAIALADQQARGVPAADIVQVPVDVSRDEISAADFAAPKAAVDARLPEGVQATLVSSMRPSRVAGACTASLTSPLAFAFDTRWCADACEATAASPFLDSASHRWLPGAAADHLTSFGGVLPGGNGQMPATEWLRAGATATATATATYGTVAEPCNFADKFRRASVLVNRCRRGDTLIEAYWKSVRWLGKGLFLGEPLARPWTAP